DNPKCCRSDVARSAFIISSCGERRPLRCSRSCLRLDLISTSNLGSSNGWSQRNTRTAITNDKAAATIANIVVVVFESVTNPSISDMLTPSTQLFYQQRGACQSAKYKPG